MNDPVLHGVAHTYHPALMTEEKVSMEELVTRRLHTSIAEHTTPPYMVLWIKTEWTTEGPDSVLRKEASVVEFSAEGVAAIDNEVRGYRETLKEMEEDIPGAEDNVQDWETALAEAVIAEWPE